MFSVMVVFIHDFCDVRLVGKGVIVMFIIFSDTYIYRVKCI